MTDQPQETQPTENFNELVARVALTPIWRVMIRLLSVMPRVSRAQNDRILSHPGRNMATPGGYPARILAPDDWADAIKIVPAEPVSDNADWVIVPGSELAKVEDPVRALRGLYAAMPQHGGYLIIQYETARENRREPEESTEGILAPWHWWRSKYHTAENPGRDVTLCYEAMWELATVRDCVEDEDDRDALQNWSPRNVVIAEVRPKGAAAVAHLPRMGQLGGYYPHHPGAPYPGTGQTWRPSLIDRLKRALSEF